MPIAEQIAGQNLVHLLLGRYIPSGQLLRGALHSVYDQII